MSASLCFLLAVLIGALFVGSSTAASDLLSVEIDKPDPDSIWFLGSETNTQQQIQITVVNRQNLPNDTKIGLFTYGWVRDTLIHSSDYTEVEANGFRWELPTNAQFKDGQYVVKVFRHRRGWFKKIYAASASFQVLSIGQQARVPPKIQYVESLVASGTSQNGNLVFKLTATEAFNSVPDAELMIVLHDADTTKILDDDQVMDADRVYITKSKGEILSVKNSGGENLGYKWDGSDNTGKFLLFELPVKFTDDLYSIYFDIFAKKVRRFWRDRYVLVYRSDRLESKSFEQKSEIRDVNVVGKPRKKKVIKNLKDDPRKSLIRQAKRRRTETVSDAARMNDKYNARHDSYYSSSPANNIHKSGNLNQLTGG